jgi:hypothetical protein
MRPSRRRRSGLPLSLIIALAAPCPSAIAAIAVEERPGYVAFDVARHAGGGPPTMELRLDEALLAMAVHATGDADAVRDVRLYRLHLRGFAARGDNVSFRAASSALTGDLLREGWAPVARFPDKEFTLLTLVREGRLLGVVLFAAFDGRVIFGNLVCDAEAGRLGDRIAVWVRQASTREAGANVLGALFASGAPPGPEMPHHVLVPDGFKTGVEGESLRLSDAEAGAFPGASGGQGVPFDDPDSAARGSVRLEPGIYRAQLIVRPSGPEQDSLMFAVDGKPAERVYRLGSGFGPVQHSPLVKVKAARDVAVEITAAETGVVLDRIDFERLRPNTKAPAPPKR